MTLHHRERVNPFAMGLILRSGLLKHAGLEVEGVRDHTRWRRDGRAAGPSGLWRSRGHFVYVVCPVAVLQTSIKLSFEDALCWLCRALAFCALFVLVETPAAGSAVGGSP